MARCGDEHLERTLALVTSAALASPALAAVEALDDPAGDATQNGLDVTRASLDNRERGIVVRARFADLTRGDLIVSVDPRRARGVRLVSENRPNGDTANYVLAGAFTDRRGGGGEAIDCSGFRVRWSDDTSRARMRLPSTCLQGGDYGAVRFSVLTERGGGDSDYAPDNRRGASSWVPRG